MKQRGIKPKEKKFNSRGAANCPHKNNCLMCIAVHEVTVSKLYICSREGTFSMSNKISLNLQNIKIAPAMLTVC